MHVMYVMKTWN